MKNLENNKIYKLGQISLFSLILLSLTVMVIRSFSATVGLKYSFLSSYLVWRFFDIGLISYQANPGMNMIIRTVVSCGLFLFIYIICLILSKNRFYFMVGALSCFVLDTAFFAYETMIQKDMTKLLIIGLVFKLFIIAIMSIGVFYGYIGKRIEGDESSAETPDFKYVNKNFSNELATQKRKITFEREKSFINSYIYLQLILDGKTKHYLKNGETYEIETDANQHNLLVVCHFENVEPIMKKIPIGKDNDSYILEIERKFPFKKAITIHKKQ